MGRWLVKAVVYGAIAAHSLVFLCAQQINLGTQVKGVLASANGGTGVNTSATTGCPKIDMGTWTFSPTYCSTGAGDVSSVFGRVGVVTAQTGDYSAAQISGLGTMALQNANAVNVTGFMITGEGGSNPANSVRIGSQTGTSYYDSNGPDSATPGGFDFRCVTGGGMSSVDCWHGDGRGDWGMPGYLTVGGTATVGGTTYATNFHGDAAPSMFGAGTTIGSKDVCLLDGTDCDLISVFGRNGDVVAATGDYNVGQVTGAAPLASPTFTGNATSPHFVSNGATPTVVAGPAAGTTPPSLAIIGDDTAGTVGFVPNSGTSTGVLFTVTYAVPYPLNSFVFASCIASTIPTYVFTNSSSTSFSVNAAGPLTAGDGYVCTYIVFGR